MKVDREEEQNELLLSKYKYSWAKKYQGINMIKILSHEHSIKLIILYYVLIVLFIKLIKIF